MYPGTHRSEVDATIRERRPAIDPPGNTEDSENAEGERTLCNAQSFSSPSPPVALALPTLTAQAQYYPPPQTRPSAFYLGKAHVDGRNDHDDIKVGRYEGRFHSVLLQVHDAPILFDRVVIHYEDAALSLSPSTDSSRPAETAERIVLPGPQRVIHSLELWYSRARPEDPNRPEVELSRAP